MYQPVISTQYMQILQLFFRSHSVYNKDSTLFEYQIVYELTSYFTFFLELTLV